MSDAEIPLAADPNRPEAAEHLLPLVYEELRKLAAARLAHEKPGQTLQATGLVHEAYLRLVAGRPDQQWQGRGHFFAAAAQAMRRILVEQARRKRRLKRGAACGRQELADLEIPCIANDDELLAIHEALDRLADEDPHGAEIVKLRYFTGLSVAEAADSLGISRSTAYEHWTYAKAWLHVALYGDDSRSSENLP